MYTTWFGFVINFSLFYTTSYYTHSTLSMLGLICGLVPGHLFLWQIHVLKYILHYRLASKLHLSQSTQQNFSVHRYSSCTRLQNVWYGCKKAEAVSVAKHVLGDLSKSCRLWALPQCKFAASTFPETGSSDAHHYLQLCVHVFLIISTCTMLPLEITEVKEVCFCCMQLLNKCPLQQLGCPMLMSCAWSIKTGMLKLATTMSPKLLCTFIHKLVYWSENGSNDLVCNVLWAGLRLYNVQC